MLSYKDIAKIFEEIEIHLINSLKRNLTRHKNEEKQYKMNWSAWQAEKLRNLDKFRRENSHIMNSYTKIIDSGTHQIMNDEFSQGINGVNYPVSNGISKEPQFFGIDHTKVNKLIDDVVNLEKHAETAVLRTMDDVYRQTVNKVQLAMNTGSMTLQQAIDMAVQDFLNKGINCIMYRDGRRINIADYVRMALRTTATRANLQGQSAKIKALGYDTVLVSSYSMCSETCLPWQGRPYIDDTFSLWDGEIQERGDELWGKSHYCGKWFPLLSSAIQGGLFHPNCRHTILMWRDGDPIPQPVDNSKNNRRYKLEQQQRHLENKVRKAKRLVAGQSNPTNIKKAKKLLRNAQKELREFIADTNFNENETVLKRDYGKEKIYQNNLTFPQNSDKINLNDNSDIYKPVTQQSINNIPNINIFNDANLNERYRTACQDLLKEVKKHSECPVGTEFSIVYDENMKYIDNYGYRIGTIGNVKLSNPNVPFHAFHNHGSGETFSYTDLICFVNSNNMLSLTAVGNNGNVFNISKKTNRNDFGYRAFLRQQSSEIFFSANNADFTLDLLTNASRFEEAKLAISNLNISQIEELKKSLIIQTEKCMMEGEIYGFIYQKRKT